MNAGIWGRKKKSQKPSSMTGVSLAGGLHARPTLWGETPRVGSRPRGSPRVAAQSRTKPRTRCCVETQWEARVVPGGVTPSVVFLEEGLIRRDFTDKG